MNSSSAAAPRGNFREAGKTLNTNARHNCQSTPLSKVLRIAVPSSSGRMSWLRYWAAGTILLPVITVNSDETFPLVTLGKGPPALVEVQASA